MSIYRSIVTADQVGDAVLATAKLWAPAYLAEVGRQRGMAKALEPFRAWERPADFGDLTSAHTPMCAVAVPGLLGQPRRAGNGRYEATWGVGVFVAVAGPTRDAAAKLASRYAGAVGASIVQHPTLGGLAESAHWIDATYNELQGRDAALRSVASLLFAVTVEDVLDAYAGPKTPPVDPNANPGDWPTVLTHRSTALHTDPIEEAP